MFIAMNRFKIALGHEGDFEAVGATARAFSTPCPASRRFIC